MASISILDAIRILMKIYHLSHDDSLTKFQELVNVKCIEDVLNDIEDMESKYYLEQHPYEIYYSEADKRYRTYLPPTQNGGRRKPITSVSKSNLEKKIIAYYKQLENKTDTIESLYPVFLKYKGKETSLGNAHKLNWSWEKYYKNDKLVKRRFTDITVAELKEWYLDKIEEFHLTNRQYKEMKSLMNMLYDYAIELQVVKYNVSRNVKNISYKKFKPTKKKSISEQVFINDEETQIIQLALEEYQKTLNTSYLAVCLNFTLALRVGELVALEKDDFSKDIVHIQRQEVKKYRQDTDGTLHRDGYEVVPYTKSLDSDREIILTSYAKYFLSLIIKANESNGFNSEYLFLTKNGTRMHNDAINRALRKLNAMINTSQKGNHSIRKTTLSNLKASCQLTSEEIRTFAGHKDISTTEKCYFFATESLDNRTSAYESAISNKMPHVFKRVQAI